MIKQNYVPNFLTNVQAGLLLFVVLIGFSSVVQAQVCTTQVDGNLTQYQQEVLNGDHPSAVSVLASDYNPLDNLGPWHTVDPKDVNGTGSGGNCTATTLNSNLVVDFSNECLQSGGFIIPANIGTIDPNGLPVDTEIEWHYNWTYFATTALDEPLQAQNEWTYTLYINKWFACEYTDQIIVNFEPDPDIDATVVTSTCNNGQDQNDGSVTISVDTNDIWDPYIWTQFPNETSLSLSNLSAWTYMFEYTYGGSDKRSCNGNFPVEVPGTDCPAFVCDGLAVDLSGTTTELACGLSFGDILVNLTEPSSANSTTLYEISVDGSMIINGLTASSFPYTLSNYALWSHDIQVKVSWQQDNPECTKQSSVTLTEWECSDVCLGFDMTATVVSDNTSCRENTWEVVLNISAWDDLEGETVSLNYISIIDSATITSNTASFTLDTLAGGDKVYTAQVETTDGEWNLVVCNAQIDVTIQDPVKPNISVSSDIQCPATWTLEAQTTIDGDWSWKDSGGNVIATTANTSVSAAWTYSVSLVDPISWCESNSESVAIDFASCVIEPTCDDVTIQYSGITTATTNATWSAGANTCKENGVFDLDFDSISWWEAPYIVTIDGLQYTSQNIIEDLAEWSYDFQIKDSNWCTSIKTFNVGCEIQECEVINVDIQLVDDSTSNCSEPTSVNFDLSEINWSPANILIDKENQAWTYDNVVNGSTNPNNIYTTILEEWKYEYTITPPFDSQCEASWSFEVTIEGCDVIEPPIVTPDPVEPVTCGDDGFDWTNSLHNPNGDFECNGLDDVSSCSTWCASLCVCAPWPEGSWTTSTDSSSSELIIEDSACILDPNLVSPDLENSNPANFSNAVRCQTRPWDSADEELNGAEEYWKKVWSESDCVPGIQCQRYIPWSCGVLDDSTQILFSKRKHIDPAERCDYGAVPTATNWWEYTFEATNGSFPFNAKWKCPASAWATPTIECEFDVYPVPLCFDLNVAVDGVVDTNQSLVIGHDVSWSSWDGLIDWNATVVDNWLWAWTNPVSYTQSWPYSIEIQMNGTVRETWTAVATSCIKTVLVWDVIIPDPITPAWEANDTACGPVDGMTIDTPEYGIDLAFAWWLDSFCDADISPVINYNPSEKTYFWRCPGMDPQDVCEISLNQEDEEDGPWYVQGSGWSTGIRPSRWWGRSPSVTSSRPIKTWSPTTRPTSNMAVTSTAPIQIHGVPIAPLHGVPIQSVIEITELLEVVEVVIPKEQTQERIRIQDISQECYYEDGHTTDATDFEDMSQELSDQVNELNAAHCIWNWFSDNKVRFRPRQEVTLGEQLKTFARHLKLNREWFHDIVLWKEWQIDRGKYYYGVLADEMTISIPAYSITTDTLHAPIDMSTALWLFIDIIDHFVPEVPAEDLATIRGIITQYQGKSYTREDMVYMTAFLNQYLLKKNPFAFQTPLVEVGNAEQNPSESTVESAKEFLEKEVLENDINQDDLEYRGNELKRIN